RGGWTRVRSGGDHRWSGEAVVARTRSHRQAGGVQWPARASAAHAARHRTATIHRRAGTRMPLNPGSHASTAYGPGMPIDAPFSFGSGPRLSIHISTAAHA